MSLILNVPIAAQDELRGDEMNDKYLSIDISKLENQKDETVNEVISMINDNTVNRSQRRQVMKALNKFQNFNEVFNKRLNEDTDKLRNKYQKELDEHVEKCQIIVDESVCDNWKMLTALSALTLKHKYNWSNCRIANFVEKSNQLHLDMLENGTWKDILKILDDECDIQLEVRD